ncbi:MAG: 4-(cytidine 5'-diphospho)-2-C-methyl-D-erythritol kinase [Nitrospirota bacterium]
MIKISAPAKINLCLDILKKDKSGYHEIRTVFHELPNLADELKIYESKESDHTSTVDDLIPQENNLVHKALKLLKKDQNISTNAKIIIHKRIPIAAGLGGASSDAAATLKGLNELWNLNLSTEKLLDLAFQLGADVPFFILGGTALGEHYGEKLTPLKPIKCVKFTIQAKENYPQEDKTAQMYASLDLSLCGKNTEKTNLLLEGIEKEDPNLIIQNLHNDFETITPPPKNHHLTGSGPSTFKTV